ncbi:galactonate dehydratase [Paenibacillus algorifonticola]|uniref:Galactonate dehydratase n=1 Tax=Paenibacillus algorifonticola TaxID=684063 RepID=A0A1I2GVD7_9BACL|nr:galactonate dehydratase [Paenibacillus algorifonticola]SFF21103.1 galactonate dehydratase [Paenibacillus algorifonticola]
MKITKIKTYTVFAYRTNWIFVQVHTDEGIVGVGEATLEYNEMALLGAIQDLERYLIGQNPLNIEHLYYTLYRDSYFRGGAVLMSAISAIETCLWDINGKALGVPVYRLLGGKCRDKIKIYANGWFANAKTPDQFAEKAKEAYSRGIRALKWDPFGKAHLSISTAEMDHALNCIGAVRDAVGSEVDLLIEGHGRFNIPAAMQIAREIEPFKPLFFEEPLPPDYIEGLAQIKERSNVAIAAGERLYTKYAFRDLLEKRAVDFIQPDVSHAGGIMELKKIAAMAEAYHIPFAPHNPSGPVANAATLQLAACVPNFFILEIMYNDIPWRKDLTDEDLVFEDGCIRIPDKPGIGISLNEEEALKYPFQPIKLRHYSGNLTNIRPPEAVPYF